MSSLGGTGHIPLLGQLAGEGWFTQMGEPAATRSLTWLASDHRLREPLLRFLGDRAGVDLSAVQRLVPETVHADQSRPDIELIDSEDRILAIVEAKFGAVLTPAQVAAYLGVLRQDLAVPGRALFLLVPPHRAAAAEVTLTRALAANDGISGAVITWDEWLDMWGQVADRAADPGLSSDVRQLTAMCQTLGGMVISQLAGAATGEGWRERRSDLVKVVKLVTRQLLGSVPPGSLPMQGDLTSTPFAYRYLPPIAKKTWVQVGVWDNLADEGGTPFWLKLHKDDERTGNFQAALNRLMASTRARQVRRDQGHAWVPLHVPSDAAGPDLLDALAGEVEDVLAALKS